MSASTFAVRAMQDAGTARTKGKPYPGMGRYVVLTYDGRAWSVYAGANSTEKARKRRAEIAHHPNVLVVANEQPI